MTDLYVGRTYGLKTRVDIWTSIYVVPVEYVIFITRINFIWDFVLWIIVALLFWIDLWTKLRIYRVPPGPFKWSCQGFFSVSTINNDVDIFSENELNASHRNQFLISRIWVWKNHWWIFIIRNVVYLKVFTTLNKFNPFLLLHVYHLQGWEAE